MTASAPPASRAKRLATPTFHTVLRLLPPI
jgi:hypothetical protein